MSQDDKHIPYMSLDGKHIPYMSQDVKYIPLCIYSLDLIAIGIALHIFSEASNIDSPDRLGNNNYEQ